MSAADPNDGAGSSEAPDPTDGAASTDGADLDAVTPDALAWSARPIVDDWPRSLALPVTILVASAGAAVFMSEPGWGVASALVLLAATHRYFLRTDYALDPAGVRVRSLGGALARPWSDFRACYPHRDGIFLSPFAAPSRLDPFRGVYLRYAHNRAAVEALVLARLPAHRRAPPAARQEP